MQAENPEYRYLEDQLNWAEEMFALRKAFPDTPAGFRDAEAIRSAEEEIRRLKQTLEDMSVTRLITRTPEEPEAYMIPRKRLSERIRASFSAGNRLTILYGMGGIGKSSLAAAYAWEQRDAYDLFLQLNCENGFGPALFHDNSLHFSNLRYDHGSYRSERAYIRRKLELLEEMTEGQRVLLLLDNCDFTADAYMQQVLRVPADILVTTRMRPEVWTEDLPERWQGIEVPADGFETEEEWAQFGERLSPSADLQSARSLYQGNILAVRLHLMGTDVPSKAYYFREQGLTQSERRLLCFISRLPLEGIPVDTLKELLPATVRSLEGLVKRGILMQTKSGQVQMHPLVRQEVRERIPAAIGLLNSVVRRLADKVFNAWEDTYDNNVRMEPYAIAMLEAFPDPPVNMAKDFDRFITLLWILCRGNEAIRYSLRLYAACEKQYGLIHERTGFCALRTGAAFRNSGRIREADDWFRKAYDILEQARPSSPCMILYRIEANTRMSLILGEHGDFDGVCRHNLQAIQLSRTLREKYPDVLPGHRGNPSLEYPYALLHQGEYLFSQGNTDAAEDYLNQAVAALKETNSAVYREIEFNRLRIRILLARNHPETALTIAERCVQIAREYRGELSREYLRAMDLLADVLSAAGKPAEAMDIDKNLMETLSRYYPGEKAWAAAILQKWFRTSTSNGSV